METERIFDFKRECVKTHFSLPEDYIKHKEKLLSDEGPFLQKNGCDSPGGSLLRTSLYWALIGFQKTREHEKYQQDIKEIMKTKSTNWTFLSPEPN